MITVCTRKHQVTETGSEPRAGGARGREGHAHADCDGGASGPSPEQPVPSHPRKRPPQRRTRSRRLLRCPSLSTAAACCFLSRALCHNVQSFYTYLYHRAGSRAGTRGFLRSPCTSRAPNTADARYCESVNEALISAVLWHCPPKPGLPQASLTKGTPTKAGASPVTTRATLNTLPEGVPAASHGRLANAAVTWKRQRRPQHRVPCPALRTGLQDGSSLKRPG